MMGREAGCCFVIKVSRLGPLSGTLQYEIHRISPEVSTAVSTYVQHNVMLMETMEIYSIENTNTEITK